jgi:hypothetical protein
MKKSVISGWVTEKLEFDSCQRQDTSLLRSVQIGPKTNIAQDETNGFSTFICGRDTIAT